MNTSFAFSDFFLQADLPALLICALCGLGCGLLGGFLVLRRQAMLADSLSHCVLPGLVLAYLVTRGLETPAMMAGALVACLAAAVFIKILAAHPRVDGGAALGIVFTGFFALGVFMLENLVGTRADLDAQHALYGALELTYWPAPLSWATLPDSVKNLLFAALAVLACVFVFFRPLAAESFDPCFARTAGLYPRLSGAALIALTAIMAVCAFEAVGSILVLALFVLPGATARSLCNTLGAHLGLSALVGMFGAMLGYALAAAIPDIAGLQDAPSAAGMIAVCLGLLAVAAAALRNILDQRAQAPKQRV